MVRGAFTSWSCGTVAGGKPREPRRQPSEDELALWREAMREAKPLAKREAPAGDSLTPSTPSPPRPQRRTVAGGAERPVAEQAGSAPAVSAGLDKRTAERLRRGQMPIDGRLDLHGMTQREAHRALIDFVERGRRDGRRCLLVITGRGSRSGDDDYGRPRTGVLREAVPHWLATEPLRAHVLTTASARRQHGGEGALYVLLRRQRQPRD